MGNCLTCKLQGTNLGQDAADYVIRSIDKLVIKAELNANGSVPFIPLSGAAGSYNSSFWQTYFQAQNLKNRYFVTGNIDDYANTPQEHEFVETANAIQYKARDGFTEVEFNVFGSPKGASISAFRRYKALMECGQVGVMMIDDCGALVGAHDTSANTLKLIPIDSVQVLPMPTLNSGQVAHINVKFRIPHYFDHGTLTAFIPNTTAGDLDLSTVSPIVPLKVTNIAAADASDVVTFNVFAEATQVNAGNSQAGLPQVGVIAANVTVTRNGAPVVVSALTDLADGNYSATLASNNTTGDDLTVQVVQPGYESPAVPYTVS
jgi:hypothetical protein